MIHTLSFLNKLFSTKQYIFTPVFVHYSLAFVYKIAATSAAPYVFVYKKECTGFGVENSRAIIGLKVFGLLPYFFHDTIAFKVILQNARKIPGGGRLVYVVCILGT